MEKTTRALSRVYKNFLNIFAGIRIDDFRYELGFNQFCKSKCSKRALLVYRVQPFKDLVSGKKIVQFSSDGANISIAKVLNQLGYELDVIDWNNEKPRLKNNYDLIFVHGGVNYENIKKNLKDDGKIFYYSTGSYWKYHNQQELERFEKFNKRHNSSLKPDRKIHHPEEVANRRADLIISLGNSDTAKTYKTFRNVSYLHAASVDEDRAIPIYSKDYSVARYNFLFMAGPGGIHKGLDWALDYFKDSPDLHLHIMMNLEEDFVRFYKKALFETENIHYHGYVEQRSEEFYAILDKCASSILLSCSEGSPGSVIESMHQGLIPVVTKSSHIDIGDCGIVIDNINMNTLDKAIRQISAMDMVELKKLCIKSNKLIVEKYSIGEFEKELTKIIISNLEAKI